MAVKERIKEARQALGLSQAKFAKNIPIATGYMAEIELGNRKVNDRIIKLICVQYSVSEAWLREGAGEMFTDGPDPRVKHVVRVFERLHPDFQDYVLEQIDRLLELQQKQSIAKGRGNGPEH